MPVRMSADRLEGEEKAKSEQCFSSLPQASPVPLLRLRARASGARPGGNFFTGGILDRGRWVIHSRFISAESLLIRFRSKQRYFTSNGEAIASDNIIGLLNYELFAG